MSKFSKICQHLLGRQGIRFQIRQRISGHMKRSILARLHNFLLIIVEGKIIKLPRPLLSLRPIQACNQVRISLMTLLSLMTHKENIVRVRSHC
jgi:hypothetical protein